MLAAGVLLVGGSAFTACSEYDLDERNPEGWGSSIYSWLDEQGNYTNTVRMIDELGYREVLAKTGSKTLFVADDAAYERFYQNNKWGATSYGKLSLPQKKQLLFGSMLDNSMQLSILPSVTPSLKAVGYVRLKSQYNRYAEHRRGKRQNNCFEIARAHKRNKQECHEEDQRCAKIVHQRQTAANSHRIGDKQPKISLLEQAIHGRGTDEDKADLAQLRGLQGHAADDQPVFGAVVFRTKQKRDHQKNHTGNGCQIPDILCDAVRRCHL